MELDDSEHESPDGVDARAICFLLLNNPANQSAVTYNSAGPVVMLPPPDLLFCVTVGGDRNWVLTPFGAKLAAAAVMMILVGCDWINSKMMDDWPL